ncbi:unnamed protein product, partial [Phaeothamnion confervicola]
RPGLLGGSPRRFAATPADVAEAPPAATTAAAETADPKVAAMRAWMEEAGVDAFIVPSDDPHLSEYAAECYNRREWLSGFTGSAGTVVITKTLALLWTDGRYFLQAERELGPGWTLMRGGDKGVPTVRDWLAAALPAGGAVGLDPLVHSASFADELRTALDAKGVLLRPLEHRGADGGTGVAGANPVDAAWGAARPTPPAAPARVHAMKFAGRGVAEKLADARAAMKREGADALVVCMLDEVAYLLNIRGADIAHCPVAMAYAVVEAEAGPTEAGDGGSAAAAAAGMPASVAAAATLFIDEAKVPAGGAVARHLAAAGVAVRPYEEALPAVRRLAAACRRVWLDPARSTFAFAAAVPAELRVAKTSPLAMAKAVKNGAELSGMRGAHIRDGVAMARFLSWLDAAVRDGGASFTEVEVDTHLRRYRAADPLFLDESFPTIAGAGPNGAVIHYRAEPATAGRVDRGSVFLLDSGAQYADGTTDVTRTMHFGVPTAFEKEAYTRVLQGHIGIDRAVFPEGTSGALIDSFARRALWAAGLDYPHGTGHGVGAALNVHEGPHSISPRPGNATPLQPGMIVSNEPGYYEPGRFGIRIENLLVVRE